MVPGTEQKDPQWILGDVALPWEEAITTGATSVTAAFGDGVGLVKTKDVGTISHTPFNTILYALYYTPNALSSFTPQGA